MGNTQDQDKGNMNKQNQHQPTLLEQAQLTDEQRRGAFVKGTWERNSEAIANAATRKAFEVLVKALHEKADKTPRNPYAYRIVAQWLESQLHAQLQQEEAHDV